MKERPADELRLESEDDDDVTASEVAAYTYCAKAWHLERVLHTSAGTDGQRRRAEGVERHIQHGARLTRLHRFGRRWLWVSVGLFVVAGLLLVAAFLL